MFFAPPPPAPPTQQAAPPDHYYPPGAQKAGAQGMALLSCQVQDSGLVSNCTVVSESPPGMGFGEAALKMSAMFKMKKPAQGWPADRTVRLPIRFALPGQPSAPGEGPGG